MCITSILNSDFVGYKMLKENLDTIQRRNLHIYLDSWFCSLDFISNIWMFKGRQFWYKHDLTASLTLSLGIYHREGEENEGSECECYSDHLDTALQIRTTDSPQSEMWACSRALNQSGPRKVSPWALLVHNKEVTPWAIGLQHHDLEVKTPS